MTRFTPARPASFALRLAVGAAVLLCVQVGVYLLVLEDTVGGVSLLRASPARDPSMTRDARATVLRSEATAGLWSPEAYEQRVRAWTEALDGVGVAHSVVAEKDLPGALSDASLLVLPGATCLGEPARAAVRRFLGDGRGLVATGAAGARDGDCAWAGWDFLAGLTGAEHVEAAFLPGAVFAAFRGEGFWDEVVPPGYRLDLPYQELVLVEAADAAVQACDWRLRRARAEAAGLAVHREVGGGRVVWLGFDESGTGRRPEQQAVVGAYLGAAARWAGRQPMATVGRWPGKRPAAATVAVVAGEREDRLAGLAAALRAAGVEGAYVAETTQPRLDPAWGGEIATSGDSDEPFAGQTLREQRRRLSVARRALEASGPRRVTGFLPPAGATDADTLRAAAEAGLFYTLGEVGGLRAAPEHVEVPSPHLSLLPGRPLVRLFRVAADDQEVLARPGDPAAAFVRDFHRARELGGLYTLTLHSDLAGSEELLPAVGAVLAAASREGAWLAGASEVARWWAARAGLRVSARRLSPYRVQVDLGNHGQELARDVVVALRLPYAPRRVELRSPVLRLRLPAIEREGDVLRLRFAEVGAQSNHTYVVSLDE